MEARACGNAGLWRKPVCVRATRKPVWGSAWRGAMPQQGEPGREGGVCFSFLDNELTNSKKNNYYKEIKAGRSVSMNE